MYVFIFNKLYYLSLLFFYRKIVSEACWLLFIAYYVHLFAFGTSRRKFKVSKTLANHFSLLVITAIEKLSNLDTANRFQPEGKVSPKNTDISVRIRSDLH